MHGRIIMELHVKIQPILALKLEALWRLDPTTSMEFRMEGNVLNKKFQSHNTTSNVKSSLDKNILKSSLGEVEVYEHVKLYMDFISSVN
jgi:hypothetical protein